MAGFRLWQSRQSNLKRTRWINLAIFFDTTFLNNFEREVKRSQFASTQAFVYEHRGLPNKKDAKV